MMIDLEAIKARAEAAIAPTGGDTRWWHEKATLGWEVYTGQDEYAPAAEDLMGMLDEPTAAFIAHAREDVPALVAEVERLRALVDLWVPRNHTATASTVSATWKPCDNTFDCKGTKHLEECPVGRKSQDIEVGDRG